MSVAEAEVKPKKGELTERVVRYKPLNGGDEIELTINMVRKFLTKPTKAGREASDAEVVKFMMLCKAGSFDPWQGDAVLVGYDSNDGAEWSLITTVHAMLKRAELSDNFDGLDFGIVVMGADKQVTERQGTIVYDNETLLGGWCKVYRKDRSRPFYCQVNLRTYDKGIFRWKTDRPGMIAKVAKGQAMRDAFPNSLAGVYLREEFDAMDHEPKQLAEVGAAKVAAASALTDRLKARNEAAKPVIESKPEVEVYSELFESLASELLTVTSFEDLEPIEAEVAMQKDLSEFERKRLKSLLATKKSSLSAESN